MDRNELGIAMGRMANALERQGWRHETVALVLDGICELGTLSGMETALRALAQREGLMHVVESVQVEQAA